VAERQGQAAARNMLGRRQPFQAVPYFWTRQFGVSIRYVGHAERWDAVEVDGSLELGGTVNCRVTYTRSGRRLAVVTVGRDRESLQVELEMESSVA
jgi:hypothetical protein